MLSIWNKTGRSSRKFGFKEQFTVMACIQLAARRSMRDGLRCLAATGNRLYHWGMKSVARSTPSLWTPNPTCSILSMICPPWLRLCVGAVLA
ncbi:MAG: DUF4372 domain-containing protein [Desulfovibrio sp.]|nr:DUF4372 domain-containing protein [Desulfovibrio sp.]